jgi:hypothetical protein
MSVFRFKLADDFVNLLTEFSKIHQYDDRKDYKDTWKKWCNENQECIQREKYRLKELGYDGDVEDKMYKAGRYYFRNKKSNKEPVSVTIRRSYISTDIDVIEAMDNHITRCAKLETFTPAEGYNWFCEEHSQLLRVEINRIISADITLSAKQIIQKIKKTYKNRYFIYSKRH